MAQLADLISIIRFEMGYAENLASFADRVNYNFMQWTLRRNAGAVHFTDEQMEWLRLVKDHEEYGHDYYPLEHMEKLAALFDIPVTELLDDFNMFLYNDQGKQIREKRFALNMTQCEYADMLGVHIENLKKWEQNRVQVFKSTWEHYFK